MTSFPTAKDTSLGDTVTQSANAANLRKLGTSKPVEKVTAYTVFTAEPHLLLNLTCVDIYQYGIIHQ